MNIISSNKKIIITIIIFLFLFTSFIACSKIKDANKLSAVQTEESKAAPKGTTSLGYEEIFKKDNVIDIHVNISEDDWKSILDDPLAEEYKSATVMVDGVTLENVGFRTKGNMTLRSVAKSDSDRYSFRIKLDKYVDGQNLLGLDEFVVNNMYSDPSYMREYLSYEALREIGADVPLTVFANIYINDELYGFYLCVEATDESFLERSFGDDSGNLYKQEQGSTLQYAEGSNYDNSELKAGNDEAKSDLKNFIKILNEMPEGEKGEIESVLDVDSALRYIAANTVIGSYDSYNGNTSHNYYLYGQNGKFTVIPWDYNMSIGGFGGGDQTTIPIDEPVMGVNIESLQLIDNLLAVDEYKEKYHEYINELLEYLENFEERVTEVANIIRPYVEADPSKFYTMEQFEASITYQDTTETNADTVSSASQNINKGAGNEMHNQPPQDMVDGFSNGNMGKGNQRRPEGFFDENRQGPPEGFPDGNRQEPPEGGMDGNMQGGPNGGIGMMGSTTSILNFIRDRVENIKQQLAGELPTTGNTTMNNRMGGGKNNFQKTGQ